MFLRTKTLVTSATTLIKVVAFKAGKVRVKHLLTGSIMASDQIPVNVSTMEIYKGLPDPSQQI